MTTHEKDTQILKDCIERKVEDLEKGECTYVSGGYIQRGYEENVIDSTSFSIIDIEFPETEDIIAEYSFMYGFDYDKIEVEIN